MRSYRQKVRVKKINEKTQTSIHGKSLAKKHRVVYRETELDIFANTAMELSGDAVRHDETKNLIIALFLAKVISKCDVVRLTTQHIRELRDVDSVD